MQFCVYHCGGMCVQNHTQMEWIKIVLFDIPFLTKYFLGKTIQSFDTLKNSRPTFDNLGLKMGSKMTSRKFLYKILLKYIMKPDTFILNIWNSLCLALLIAWNVLQNGKKKHLSTQCYYCALFLPSMFFLSLFCTYIIFPARRSAGSSLPSVHCSPALGILSSRPKQPVPVFSVFCSYSSLYRYLSPCSQMHAVCCHQYAVEVRAATILFACVCDVSCQTWNFAERSQGKVSLL